MEITQAIERPYGVSVFGSATLRVEPDIVALNFTVTVLEQQPKEAFRKTHELAQQVRAYLDAAHIGDFGASRVTLTATYRYSSGESRFVGYTAEVAFHVLLRDLERMEDILVGVVDAGATGIRSVEFQTSRLKEIRAEARRRAVVAAREKAENYASAAGVQLGPTIHIEDVDPDVLQGIPAGHSVRTVQTDDAGEPGAFDPGGIIVGAAVMLAFEIGR